MKLTISERERGAVFAILEGANDWGGNESALLVRDALYTALGLERFEGRAVQLGSLSTIDLPVELTEEEAHHLRDLLVRPGQARVLARVTAAILRRLLPLLAPASARGGPPAEAAPS